MRYLPLTGRDRGEMLAAIGVDSIDELFADVPDAARLDGLLDLPMAMGEGWFIKLRLIDPKQLESLMDQTAYDAFVAEQEQH